MDTKDFLLKKTNEDTMRVLVVGNGGREHAIVYALSQSIEVEQIHVIGFNAGMAMQAVCHGLHVDQHSEILALIEKHQIDFVVIGPEAPLVNGLSDYLRSAGIAVVGPSQSAAQLEGSKVFAKKFMINAGVPTARYTLVQSVEECMNAALEYSPPFVLKADGLAGGKGVSLSDTLEDLKSNAEKMFNQKIFAQAGSQAVLEEYQPGWELSYIVLTNGSEYQVLPLTQDHKRLSDGDTGPNTGGMGVVGPVAISESLKKQIDQEIVRPSLAELNKQKMLYWGFLYIGLMITEKGPKVIEYNVRLGDPEAQVILPLLKESWGEVLKSLSEGKINQMNWKPLSSACVVMAAPGYPENVKKDLLIEGEINFHTPSSYFIHCATKRDENGKWLTDGGRVLNAIGVGSDLKEALDNAYKQTQKVSWSGIQFRNDIGHRLI